MVCQPPSPRLPPPPNHVTIQKKSWKKYWIKSEKNLCIEGNKLSNWYFLEVNIAQAICQNRYWALDDDLSPPFANLERAAAHWWCYILSNIPVMRKFKMQRIQSFSEQRLVFKLSSNWLLVHSIFGSVSARHHVWGYFVHVERK